MAHAAEVKVVVDTERMMERLRAAGYPPRPHGPRLWMLRTAQLLGAGLLIGLGSIGGAQLGLLMLTTEWWPLP
jgi:hypothetical protein